MFIFCKEETFYFFSFMQRNILFLNAVSYIVLIKTIKIVSVVWRNLTKPVAKEVCLKDGDQHTENLCNAEHHRVTTQMTIKVTQILLRKWITQM